MRSDIEIAHSAELKLISKIADALGISDYEPYGKYKAKIKYDNFGKKQGKLILVTAINPTPLGEGKTTMSIGLADAFHRLNRNVALALREPSLGPVFGIKGGAAGGGYSQVVPMEDINLHFTGDIHAIESANNLLAALIDNHIYQGNELDFKKVTWRRCMDMNDRQLRFIECGLGGKANGVPRADGFDITVASEIMAIFCLASSLEDLTQKLGDIIVGYNSEEKPIFARDLHAEGAMTALLRDAFNPNLVQTLEGTPAFIHGGPFANIAHGCNSLVATKLAMSYADYVITEAGFGSDLGAEKFFDIKCLKGDLQPSAVVLVATLKALKYNGGVAKEDVNKPNMDALRVGVGNMLRHIKTLKSYKIPLVVCINKYDTDTQEEIDYIKSCCGDVRCVVSTAHRDGGKGSIELALAVQKAVSSGPHIPNRPYNAADPDIKNKMNALAQSIYGAENVEYNSQALSMIERIERLGYSDLPICVAKTQYSFSDDPKLLGAPEPFTMHVNEVRLCGGAGFIVMICGKIMTMPGLPRVPAANNIYVDKNHEIVGLF